MVVISGCSPWTQIDGGRYLSNEGSTDEGFALVYIAGHTDPKSIVNLDTDGVLAVFPEGTGRFSWSVGHHKDEITRDDRAFLDGVRQDLQDRFDVDVDVYLAGFSEGASMSYDLACGLEHGFSGFFPMSGAFWKPAPQTCIGPAVPIRHRHGDADLTWPVEGGEGNFSEGKGSALDALLIAADSRGCSAETQQVGSCSVWSCELELCTYPGGHAPPSSWAVEAVQWIREQN
jgi:polyhydroxybutyrate depolymerase